MQPKPRIVEYAKLSTTVTLHCVRSGAACVRGRHLLTSPMQQARLSLFRCRWIPDSARLVALGSYARGTGCLQVTRKLAQDRDKPAPQQPALAEHLTARC